MSTAPNPTPADPTQVSAMLELLRSRGATFTDRALIGQLSWWIGSGVSRTRVPDVKSLLRQLLHELYTRIDRSVTDCPARGALNQLVDLASATGVDVAIEPKTWGQQYVQVVEALASKYSDALGISFAPGGVPHDVCWDLLRLQETYSDAAVRPDAEHRFLALLISEGIIRELVTTNWDPLIERALGQCRGPRGDPLKIVARPADLPGRGNEPQLMKIHGCAERAKQDEAGFRPFLIATRTQIMRWDNSPQFQALREALRVLTRASGVVFVGLSGQDYDIQAAHFVARESLGAPPTSTPSVFFCSTRVEEAHRQVLRSIYGESAYAAQQPAIDGSCLIPAYAKPLLGALYLKTILAKLLLIAELGAAEMTPALRSLCAEGIDFVKAFVCNRYDAMGDSDARWRGISNELARFIAGFASLYIACEALDGQWRYVALWGRDLQSLRSDAAFAAQREYRLLLFIGLLGRGTGLGLWSLDIPAGRPGVVRVRVGAGCCDLLVGRDSVATVAMESKGLFDEPSCERPVVVFPHQKRPQHGPGRRGSPGRRLPGRGVPSRVSEVWMLDLMDETDSPDELLEALAEELRLVALA